MAPLRVSIGTSVEWIFMVDGRVYFDDDAMMRVACSCSLRLASVAQCAVCRVTVVYFSRLVEIDQGSGFNYSYTSNYHYVRTVPVRTWYSYV
jgi:hypothetical protein